MKYTTSECFRGFRLILSLKISDFGLIKWEEFSGKTEFIEHLTARGNINYVPPETFTQNPEPPGTKYDVYR